MDTYRHTETYRWLQTQEQIHKTASRKGQTQTHAADRGHGEHAGEKANLDSLLVK